MPSLQDGLAEDDSANILDEDSEEGTEAPPALTPEMITAQFAMIDAAGALDMSGSKDNIEDKVVVPKKE